MGGEHPAASPKPRCDGSRSNLVNRLATKFYADVVSSERLLSSTVLAGHAHLLHRRRPRLARNSMAAFTVMPSKIFVVLTSGRRIARETQVLNLTWLLFDRS